MLWQLPRQAQIGGKTYDFCADFRDILEIFAYWDDPDLPEFVKWEIALALFYKQAVRQQDKPAAMAYLAGFINAFQPEAQAGAKLMDWQHDASLILSDINKVAGQEIRSLPFVHWWTFLSWFHAIGQGRLSEVVAIRQKLQGGKKLESWEQLFYKANKAQIRLPMYQSKEKTEEIARLERLLSGGKEAR